MSRYSFANALSVADFIPPPESPPTPDDTIEQPPPTKRLKKLDLEAALAAMDLAEALESDESTLTVSAEENNRLLAKAFRPKKTGRPNTDDEPTLDAPAPKIPPGIPSPLGDDDDHQEVEEHCPETSRGVMIPRWSPDVDLEQVDLDLHLDSIVAPPPPSSSEHVSGIRRAGSNVNVGLDLADYPIPLPADEPAARTDRISLAVSGLRRTPLTASVTPDTFKEVMTNRAAQRQVREEERRTRYVVLGIWSFALIVAALFTYMLMTTKTSTISSSSSSSGPAAPAAISE